MRIFPAALVASVILVALSSGVATAENQSPHVEAQSFPSITLNTSGGVNYNLTYAGLYLETPNGSYMANFNHGKWNFATGNNGTYAYSSEVRFLPDNSKGTWGAPGGPQGKRGNPGKGNTASRSISQTYSPLNPGAGGPPSGKSDNIIGANVIIAMKELNYSLSNMSVSNTSAKSLNFSFPQYSMLEITISVTFQNPVEGPGMLEMLQLIKSSNMSNGPDNYYFGNIAHDHSKGPLEKSQGIRMPATGNNTGNGTMNAFYWWNSAFQLNGATHNLTSAVTQGNGAVYIAFNFSYNSSTSLKSVYQDPYIGISGEPIFKNPIVQKVVGTVVNYVMVNAEYFATGLVSGIVLIGGTTYSIYRKRRF